jgi:hypothetical protein
MHMNITSKITRLFLPPIFILNIVILISCVSTIQPTLKRAITQPVSTIIIEKTQPEALFTNELTNTPFYSSTITDNLQLRYSIYFLSDIGNNNYQIFRLDKNRLQRIQVTNEPRPIKDYRISKIGGHKVILTDRWIYLDEKTRTQQVILEKLQRPNGVSDISEDGKMVIYTENTDLYIYYIDTKISSLVLAKTESYGFSGGKFSPDGKTILAYQYKKEGSGFCRGRSVIYDLSTKKTHNFDRLRKGLEIEYGNYLSCIYKAYWSKDSNQIYLLESENLYKSDKQGLGELMGKIGNGRDIFLESVEIVGDQYIYFLQNEGDNSYSLVRSRLDDLGNIAKVREERFAPFQALFHWSPDGEFLIFPISPNQKNYSPPELLIPMDSSKSIITIFDNDTTRILSDYVKWGE